MMVLQLEFLKSTQIYITHVQMAAHQLQSAKIISE